VKVAIVTHDVKASDGQGRVNLELVRYLSGAGHQVHIYANQVDPGLVGLPGVVWHRVPVRMARPDLLKCVEFMTRVSLMLRSHRCDILHLNGAVALVHHHVNTAHFVHRTWLAGGFTEVPGLRGIYHRLYRRYNAWLEGVVFGRALRVVGVSPKAADEVQRHCGLPAGMVRCVPNGCDPPPPALSAPERERLRQELWPGLAPDELLAGFAGDLRTSRKGIDTVLRAMDRIRGERVRLVVAGSTADSLYPAMAEALGLGGQVRFLGFRRDLGRVFQALDCFVFPSRYETFGLVVTEAAAAGCPLLISGPRHCGAAGLFRDEGGAVFLADPADDGELAARLEHLLQDPERRLRLGAEARQAVRGWGWQQMGEAYEALYREVLQR
jgi:glycosyltransferase involved in cell wall biosynthesis